MAKNLFLSMIVFLVMASMAIKAQTFTNYTTAEGLPSNAVNGVAVDGNDVKWFATQAGVARFDNQFWTTYTTANGVIDNFINCIAVDIYNRVWVGTDIGVSRYDGTQWTSFTTANGLVNDMINYIAPDKNGSIWICTSSGLSNFDGTNWTNYTPAQGLPNDLVSCGRVDNLGFGWFGTWIGGLAKHTNSGFTIFTTADSLADNNILSIAVDQHNNKYIGTYSGITVFDSLDQWIVNYRQTEGLLNNFVKDLAFDSRGTLWTGLYDDYTMEGGITSFDGTNWVSYTIADGLVNTLVRRLAVDMQNYVWVATANGVSRFTQVYSGIGRANGKNFSIIPNPASDHIIIDISHFPVHLDLYDLTGKNQISCELAASSNKIDIRSLVPGIYFLKLTADSKSSVSKLIVR